MTLVKVNFRSEHIIIKVANMIDSIISYLIGFPPLLLTVSQMNFSITRRRSTRSVRAMKAKGMPVMQSTIVMIRPAIVFGDG